MSDGSDMILVIIDHLTKQSIFIPTINTITVRGHPISQFHYSRFHPTPRLELPPALLFELELCSAPISGAPLLELLQM